ncbi:isochorismate synthase [Loigolactobacillus backii]|uniref:isochorismate synthase n=1 Tax=Loigolactobacillus backii TaxID=375175 RepID=A0A192H170_9LACO|nr:isochorismate synthase [Loigolactobacillus backii]ANK62100.1 hypothetical protein AYR53_04545 [Loigolactobacillus backii]ANK68706.1 hypothetical protein AYR56_00180 [Loigolactobacillus backii]MDA5386709.1 isochorismate synthase [Loigolactobacillus backii]MDA5389234.1 isochorismate synthase [Loigolactobacillus backii]
MSLQTRVIALNESPQLAQLIALGQQSDPYFAYETPEQDFCLFGFSSCQTWWPIAFGNEVGRLQDWTTKLKQQFQTDITGYDRGLGPQLLGGLPFAATAKQQSRWGIFRHGYFFLPRFLITKRDKKWWLTVTAPLAEDLAKLAEDFLHRLQTIEPLVTAENQVLNETALYAEQWQQGVRDTVARIQRSDLDKVVLARPLVIEMAQSIQAAGLWQQLRQRQPATYHICLQAQGQAFVSATPERLLKFEPNQFATAAVAGTVRRGKNAAEDEQLGQALLADPKNRGEQAFVVATISQNLEQLGLQVSHPAQPQLLRNPNVQHLFTPITARGLDKVTPLTVLAALHPTPALGGVPRRAALAQIAHVEPEARGLFGAPIGYLGLNELGEFAVGIRSVLLQGQQATLFAGAGIVAASQAENEFKETALKFEPIRECLKKRLDSED